MDYANVKTKIHRAELMSALRSLTVDNEDFDHRKWAIWDAEVFETAARMIRKGYSNEKVPGSRG
jgi:hypothetical protein